jgi:HD superfamily phosphodiesterase
MQTERQAAVTQVEAWVRERLDTNTRRAHGWLHTDRVRRNIRVLACAEGVDTLLAELAALLHDVGRTQPGPEREHGARSAAMAAPVLAGLPLSDRDRETVLFAVRWHNSSRDDTPLLRVLRDADMLDGLGAMGIVRAFMSKSHLPPYNPKAPFELGGNQWPPSFSSDQLLGQMEWYERLHTEAARQMARDRIDFMHAFLSQAHREIRILDD